MSNRWLLTAPTHLLSVVGKRWQFLLRTHDTPMPCPACKKPVNLFDAASIDLDDYDFGYTRYACHCPACRAELEQFMVVIVGGPALWHWELKDSRLQEQMSQARQLDQQILPSQAADPT